MALTTAQQVRLRLNDPWRYASETLYGDGTASGYKLQQGSPYSTITAATASTAGTGGWAAASGLFDTALGTLVFAAPVSAASAVRLDYQWAVFSDDEIGYFTAVGGDARGATLQGVRALMGNAWKRARWKSPDGSEYDDKAALANLKAWEQSLLDERTADDGPAGGFVNWAVSQGDY